jgi:tetratricopeptide (TPR) repeat protein
MILLLLPARPASAQAEAAYASEAHEPYLDLLHRTQQAKPSPARLGYAWALLASSYQRSGETDAALRAYGQALPLLARGPDSQANYATALDNMGEVYLEMGDVTEAERVRQKAFDIRSEMDNPVDLARSHQHLAETFLAEHRYGPAQEHAAAAAAMLVASTEPVYSGVFPARGSQASSRPGNTLVAAYITLAYAQCEQTALAACLRSAHTADELASQNFAPVSLERAHADMALAFAVWKNGDTETADRLYQGGLAMMKTVLGERHPVAVTSMLEYRDFLRGTHQNAKATVLDRSIESAQAMRRRTACARCTVSVAALP